MRDGDGSVGERAIAALAVAALVACVWRTAAAGPGAGSWPAIAALVANIALAGRRRAPARAAPLATSDPATGLLTRMAFVEACGGAARAHGRRGRRAALILIAIEGAEAGVIAAAEIARRAAPVGAVAGRLDDRTIAVLLGIDGDRATAADALADHLHGALAQGPAGRESRIAIGIADADRDLPVARLIERGRAAAALARHRPRRFDAGLDRATRAREATAAGIGAGRFAPSYRPRLDRASGRLEAFAVGADGDPALLAETGRAGLAAELTAALMRRALAEGRDLAVPLSFALDADQLDDPWLARKIVGQLVEAGFPAGRLEVAVPAHAIGEVARATLASLADQGVRIALTGVGGPGSLPHLVAELDAARLETDPALVARADLVAALGALGPPVVAPDATPPLAVGAARRLLAERGLLPGARAAPPVPLRRAG